MGLFSVARRASRRRTTPRGERVWTSLVSDSGIISTAAVGFDVVESVDWERSSVAQEHATLLRIRGVLSVSPEFADSQYNAAIIVINQSRGTPDPSSAAVLVDEDILWTFCMQGASATGSAITIVDIDVKAKRRITSSTDVRMVEISDTVSGFRSTYVLRALLGIK